MTVAMTLAEIRSRGIELWFEGDRLRFRAPKGALSPEHRGWLSANREAVIATLVAEARQNSTTHAVSDGQKAMWFIQQQSPANSAYHISVPARVRCEIALPALRGAVQALMDRHPSLRTTFEIESESGELKQVVAGWAAASVETRSTGALDDAALLTMIEDEEAQPFDLDSGPLLRVRLYTRSADDHVLVMTAHHIAADGWSLMTLFDELIKLYQEFTGGPQAGLATPKSDYIAYTKWHQGLLGGPEGERLWTYWRDRMASPREPLPLPLDRPAPAIPSFAGGAANIPVPPELPRQMRDLAARFGVTPFVIWLATFKTFLARLTGARDIIVGTPTFGRSRAEFLQVVGNFVNSVPLRSRIEPGASLQSLVGPLRTTVLEALDAQEFPFSRLVQSLHPVRSKGEAPFFNVFFVLQRFDEFKHVQALIGGSPDQPPATYGSLKLAPFPIRQRTAQFDLSLQMVEVDDGVSAYFWYNADVFDAPTVEALARDYAVFVGDLAANPEQAIDLARPARRDSTKGDAATEALLARLAEVDVQITLADGRLKVSAPKGTLDDTLRSEIVAHRDELLAYLASRDDAAPHTLARISRSGRVPLSASQRRLWFNARMQPDGNQYNTGGGLTLSGPLDIAKLQAAVAQLFRRHEALRMTVGVSDGDPDARISPVADISDRLPVIAVSSRAEAKARAEELARQPFDLAKGPLARFHLLRIADDDHLLVSCLHHVIADGWSLSILLGDLSEIYEALLQNRAPQLPRLETDAVDYAAWEDSQTANGRWNNQIEYWRRQLAGAPAELDLPTDRPRPAKASLGGKRLARHLDKELVDRLRSCAQRQGATLFMLMLGAWHALLHRMSGQDDILVGIPVANRKDHGLEATVGCFINTVPVRVRFDGAPKFTDILTQTRSATIEALDHASVPFDILVTELKPDRGSSQAPIFQVLFASLDFPPLSSLPSGLKIDPVPLDLGASRLDLTVEVAEMQFGEHAGQSLIMYEYATDLFDEATIERLHHHYWTLLSAIADDPAQPVHELPLIEPAQERRLAEVWNRTAADHDRNLCAHQMVEAAAASAPDRIAVVAKDRSLSYADLDDLSNKLARLLAGRGATRGTRVALCVDRTADMPLAALAIMKAGAAYVPLDPSHPADRLRTIIEDAGAVLVVTLDRFSHLFGDTPAVLLDREQGLIGAQSAAPVASGATPTDLAYLIYTSGSTGKPKGVEVEHRNLVAFLDAMRRQPGLASSDVVLAVTTLSFDIAGLELWLPLANAARVVIASREEALDGVRLASLMEEHGVTLFQATPATWRLLLQSGWTGKQDLVALCGGEAMPRTLAHALVPRVATLWNMYGPTETTIWSTAAKVVDTSRPISVGRPITNTRVYVLDAGNRIVPVGVAGELVIAGEGVARGYHDRPDLTSRAFGTISIAGRSERIYRTGDLARLRADGSLDYLGRRDQQVKVRGYRIELGEIEAVLATLNGIASAAVAVKSFGPGDDRLVGYATLTEGHKLDADEARSVLRSRLPEYMVPAHIIAIPKLPLTPNGKLDRSALPMPPTEQRAPDRIAVPMSESQRRLAAVWASVLRTDQVGLADNFFDLGGHSMLLVKLQAAIRSEFGKELSLVDLFQYTTVAAQAERLGSATSNITHAIARAAARARRQTHG